MFATSFESESVLSKRVISQLDYCPCQINMNVIFFLILSYTLSLPPKKCLNT